MLEDPGLLRRGSGRVAIGKKPLNLVYRAVVGLVVKARHTLPTGRGFEIRWSESTPRSGIRATGYPLSS